MGPPRGKHDGVIGHISKRENGKWTEKIVLFLDRSILHPAWLDKVGVNMNFRQFLGVLCAKNLPESRISSPAWGAPSIKTVTRAHSSKYSSWIKVHKIMKQSLIKRLMFTLFNNRGLRQLRLEIHYLPHLKTNSGWLGTKKQRHPSLSTYTFKVRCIK